MNEKGICGTCIRENCEWRIDDLVSCREIMKSREPETEEFNKAEVKEEIKGLDICINCKALEVCDRIEKNDGTGCDVFEKSDEKRMPTYDEIVAENEELKATRRRQIAGMEGLEEMNEKLQAEIERLKEELCWKIKAYDTARSLQIKTEEERNKALERVDELEEQERIYNIAAEDILKTNEKLKQEKAELDYRIEEANKHIRLLIRERDEALAKHKGDE